MELSELLIESKKSQEKITPAACVLPPLLDALSWQGDQNRVLEAMTEQNTVMTTDGLIETMANLNFKYDILDRLKGREITKGHLPLLMVDGEEHVLILNIEETGLLVFDGTRGTYMTMNVSGLKGDFYVFQYAEDVSSTLVNQQKNWFNKLMYRFSESLRSVAVLSFLITCLDLLIPVLIVLVYDQIASQGTEKALILTYLGVLLYMGSSYTLGFYRAKILNYISTRMGSIIATQTYTRLLYLSPSYTETASINAQINRIKDFENLKRFVTSDIFIDLLELVFSVVYIIAIFVMGGWIGFIPIITLVVVVLLGMAMRPFHRIRMEKHSEYAGKKQQNLIEILKNADEIKATGLSDEWLNRYKTVSSKSVVHSYELSEYVNLSKSISYFITNTSVLAVVYFGVLRIMSGQMTMGLLIGTILLYWKILSSIRSAFNLSVQVSGLLKSISQINRFMNLPQDNSLKSSMIATKTIKGNVKFKDVSLRYSKNASPALMKVELSNEPGKILGLTGHDGAGKTSVLKLILGMYKPQGGRILIDGNNIKQIEPLSLRKSVGYAPEKDIIFSGSIRDNFIALNAQITDAEIIELANKTGLDVYFKALNYSLDTELTELDIQKASQSFKKLFNITRALCRDVQLFLFDEPENYLRIDEVQRIVKVLKDKAQLDGASIIVSTKNAAILQVCDDVVKLDQGRIRKKRRAG